MITTRALARRCIRGAQVLAFAVLAIACGGGDPPPVTAAKQFTAAVQSGDVERIMGLTDAAANEHLRRVAERASDQVGGRRNIEPREMLQVVDVDPNFQVAAAELVSGDDASAVVRLTGADATTHELSLVLEDGEWRVRVALPATPVGDP